MSANELPRKMHVGTSGAILVVKGLGVVERQQLIVYAVVDVRRGLLHAAVAHSILRDSGDGHR